MKNIHHIIPVARNGKKCEQNEVLTTVLWHRKLHSVFGTMVTHEKILYLLDYYNLENPYREFIIRLDNLVDSGLLYVRDCFGRESKGDYLKGEMTMRELANPGVIFTQRKVSDIILQVLSWDIKVLRTDGVEKLGNSLSKVSGR